MTTVVISQPMLFPWVGLLEQMRVADVWVHYDDVQLSKSGFTRRVQVKAEGGTQWLTVPMSRFHRGQLINEVRLDEGPWPAEHLSLLTRALSGSAFAQEMLEIARAAYSGAMGSLAELTIGSMEGLRAYFGLAAHTRFVKSSDLGVGGSGSDRILDIVRHVGGDVYVTGHGGKNYLDHERFEDHGVEVRYMDYKLRPYPQLHGPFTPFVTALDLAANVGKSGSRFIDSPTVGWRTFLSRAAAVGS